MDTGYRQITYDGLWNKNIILGQMLALCPTLAVTNTATNGLGMGLATLAVLIITNMLVSVFRNLISPEVRIPVFVLIIAGVVTVVDMMINAWLHELYKVLGLFIPLIVTNCAILGRAESYASKYPVRFAMYDGFTMGLGFTLVLTFIGAFREIIGYGTFFANASSLLGQSFSFLQTTIIPHYGGFLIMALPPGGFIALGLILATKQHFEERRKTRESEVRIEPVMVNMEGSPG